MLEKLASKEDVVSNELHSFWLSSEVGEYSSYEWLSIGLSSIEWVRFMERLDIFYPGWDIVLFEVDIVPCSRENRIGHSSCNSNGIINGIDEGLHISCI